MTNPLHLVLKHKWFDAIKTGEKRVEYRDNSEYWRKRICGTHRSGRDQARIVIFHRGYTKETIAFKVDYIVLGSQIEIHLGERIE